MKDGFFPMIIISALITYILRFIPSWLSTSSKFAHIFKKEGKESAWIDAVGPSAILSLFLVSVLPQASGSANSSSILPTMTGICITSFFYLIRKDIVISTVSGIGAYALTIFLLGNSV